MIKALIFNKFFNCYKENLSVPYSVIYYATNVQVVNGGNNKKGKSKRPTQNQTFPFS